MNLLHDRFVVGDQLLAVVGERRGAASVVLNRHGQALQFVQGVGHGLAGRQGDVDDGLTALQRLLHRVLGAHFCALRRGDGEDRAIVLGRRDLLTRIHAVLRDAQVAARLVEVLQSNQGACVGIDAVSHFGFPLSLTISDAVLAIGSILLGVLR
ncbi:hypothetical protein D3C72_1141250 [compost metagenome]